MKTAVFWFRRDLRLEDNAGLYHALKSGYPVQPVFIFDTPSWKSSKTAAMPAYSLYTRL